MSLITALTQSTPEAAGIPSAAIEAFISAVEEKIDSLHSFIILRHGNVVAECWWEPYRPTDQHILFSLSKSFTSTAIGLLAAEGKLTTDDLVLSFFPDDAPANPSAYLQAMRVRDLLTMTTGHIVDTTAPMTNPHYGSWLRGFLAQPVEKEPGTHFLYNSGATYTLSAIVQKLTGARLLDYLQPRLFAPLGISNPRWDQSPQGIDTGGWGLWLTTADIARFGQLYLQQGQWQGQQIIPAAWVAEATARQVRNDPAPNIDWAQGYGYQFWRCRHSAYRGDGAFGQFCLVMPEQDAVLAITGGLANMQPPLDLVWEHLLPAFATAPLPADAPAQAALADQLTGRQLPMPQGTAQSPAIVGQRRYQIAPNAAKITAISLAPNDQAMLLTFDNDQGAQQLICGYGYWHRSEVSLGPLDNSPRPAAPRQSGPWKVGASGAFTDRTTYTAKLWWHETPFAHTFTFHFADDQLTATITPNVGFGELEPLQLTGTSTD